MSSDRSFVVGLDDVPAAVRNRAESVMARVAEQPRLLGKKLIRPSKIAGHAMFWARVGRDHRLVYELAAGCVRFVRLIARRDARRIGLER